MGKNSSWPLTAHEVGHFIAWSGLPGDGYEFKTATAPAALTEVMRLIRASDTFKDLARLPTGDRSRMRRPKEVFARAYAQWVAWRSGNREMRAQVDRALRATVPTANLLQWDYEEFAPIAEAMDALFEDMGWLKRG